MNFLHARTVREVTSARRKRGRRRSINASTFKVNGADFE